MATGAEEEGPEGLKPEILKGVLVSESGQVKVWGHVGIKVPITDLQFGMFEFSFGHERWAKSGTQEDIRNASRLVDEFNEQQLDRLFRKYLRQIRRINREESHDPPKKKKGKGKKSDNAMERIRGRV